MSGYLPTISDTVVGTDGNTYYKTVLGFGTVANPLANYGTLNHSYGPAATNNDNNSAVYTATASCNSMEVGKIVLGGGGAPDFNGGHAIYIPEFSITVSELYINKDGALLGGGGGGAYNNLKGGYGAPGGGGGGGGYGDVNGARGSGGGLVLNNNEGVSLTGRNGGGGGGPGKGKQGTGYTGNNGGVGGSYDTTTGLYTGYYDTIDNVYVYVSSDGNKGDDDNLSGGGGGYGGGNGGLSGTNASSSPGGGGGGGGYAGTYPSGYTGKTPGKGGYGMYNNGTITELHNSQGGNNRYGPLFYGGRKLNNYYIVLFDNNRYGQIYFTGWDWSSTSYTFTNIDNVYISSKNTYNGGSTIFKAVIVGNFTGTIPMSTYTIVGTTKYYTKIVKSTNVATIGGKAYSVFDLYYHTKPSGYLAIYSAGNKSLSVSINITDNGGTNVTGYTVQISLYSSFSPLLNNTPTANGNIYSFSNLTNGTLYYIRASATNAVGTSDYFTYVSDTPRTNPEPPTITVSTNQGSGSIKIEFTDYDTIYYNGGGTVKGHKVHYGTSYTPGGDVNNPITVPYNDTAAHIISGLQNGTSYYFSASSINSFDLESQYSVVKGPYKPYTFPAAPNLSISSVGNGTINITYSSNGHGGYGSINKYTIGYSNNINFSPENFIDNISSSSTTSSLTGFTNGLKYYLRLYAYNPAGYSSPTSAPYTVPDAPTGITLTDGDNKITLTFTAPSSTVYNNTLIDYYGYKTGSTTDYTQFTNTNPYTITGLANGSSYDIYIAAHNPAGYGAQSAIKSITLQNIPSKPTISSVSSTDKQITIAYAAGNPKNTNEDIDTRTLENFNLYYGTSSTLPTTPTILEIGKTSPYTATISTLTYGTTYYFEVESRNAKGTSARSTSGKSTVIELVAQTISVIPTQNYFFLNNKSLDTIFALDTTFGGSLTTNYKNNGTVDIGKRYLTGTSESTTSYKLSGTDLNTKFLKTSITGAPLPVDKLSFETKRFIIPTTTTTTASASATTTASISAGVYGCKLLFSSYTGPVMTIRRGTEAGKASANAYFYANSTGTLGSAYLGTGVSLTDWLNGSTAYVVQWWDQTGNANHAYQFTEANQPTYDTANNRISFPGSTFLNLPNGTHPYNDSQYTYVFKCSITNQYGGIFSGGADTNNNANSFRRATNEYMNHWYNWDNVSSGSKYVDNSVISVKYDGATRTIYQTNGIIATLASSGRQQTSANNTIGKEFTEYMAGGYIQYMYIIPLAISDADRVILENT